MIRHAKSSWKFPDLSDHDRPLNKRGQANILPMAEFLNRQALLLEKIYSSSAERALCYAQGLSDVCDIPLEVNQSLYTFSHQALMAQVHSLDNRLQSVALVGHNPAITSVVNELAVVDIANMPTAAMALIQFNDSSWQKLGSANSELLFMQSPKMLKSETP